MAAIFYYTNIQLDLGGNMLHLWSLAVEGLFYMFWSLTVLFFIFPFPHKKRLIALIGLLLAVTIFRVYLVIYPIDYGIVFIDAYRFTFTRIDNILMVAIMAMVLAEKRKHNIAIVSKSNDAWQQLVLAGLFVLMIFTIRDSVQAWV